MQSKSQVFISFLVYSLAFGVKKGSYKRGWKEHTIWTQTWTATGEMLDKIR